MRFSLLSAAATLGCIALSAAASPAGAATKEDYLAACLAIAGEDGAELCNCKAEQAAELVSEEMIDYIIMRMNDPQEFSDKVKAGEVPQNVIDAWPYYVRDSNAVCLADDEAES